MYRFQVNLFADPRDASFTATWEDAAAMLERLQRVIFELDGSFVISGDDEQGRRWQVDGHLFDFHNRLYRVELRGQCPPATFDELLRCVGWPSQSIQFELVSEGITVDETKFRQLAGAGFRVSQ